MKRFLIILYFLVFFCPFKSSCKRSSYVFIPIIDSRSNGVCNDVEQMAAAACFLLSPAASWINGITLHVGGGGHLVGNPFYHPLPGSSRDLCLLLLSLWTEDYNLTTSYLEQIIARASRSRGTIRSRKTSERKEVYYFGGLLRTVPPHTPNAYLHAFIS